MGGTWIWVGFIGLAMGCATADRLDLSANDRLYKSPGYRSKLPGDRSVFVAPVLDRRDPADRPPAQGAYPIRYITDAVWERKVELMVHDILVEELTQSRIFKAVLEQPRSDALVMVPSLERMHGGQQLMVEGARSLVEIAIRVEIHGPADASGDRTLILDETFSDSQGSAISFHPPNLLTLTGVSLSQTMGRLVSGLDASNVARSGVPLEAIGPKR